MDNVRVFLKEIMTAQTDILLVVAGIVIFIIGLVLLYKKGPWLGFFTSLFGILLIITAALAVFFSS
jgi:hypothetical protein